MKKIFSIFTVLTLCVLAFTSCKDDPHYYFQTHTVNSILNLTKASAMSDLYDADQNCYIIKASSKEEAIMMADSISYIDIKKDLEQYGYAAGKGETSDGEEGYYISVRYNPVHDMDPSLFDESTLKDYDFLTLFYMNIVCNSKEYFIKIVDSNKLN